MEVTNRRNLHILTFTLVVVTLGFGLVMPILPFYMEYFGAGGMELGLLVASYAVMRLVFGPLWGALSDKVGRRPVLMIGVLGYGIAMVGFALATKLWMLFAARILSGVLSSATSPAAMAYISDSTTSEERSRGLGLLGAAGGVGAVMGPALGGVLAEYSLATPFYAAAGFSFLALMLIMAFLPESLPDGESRTAANPGKACSLKTVRQSLVGPAGPLLLQIFLSTGGIMILYGILGLYALDLFTCTTEQVGWIFTVLGCMTVVGQGVLIGPLTERLGDRLVVRLGFGFSAVFLPLILAGGSYIQMLALIGVFSLFNAVLTPAITSLTSKTTDLDQGVMMGVSNSFVSLGRIAGPLAGGYAFDINYTLPFWLGGAVLLLGFLVSLKGRQPQPGDLQGVLNKVHSQNQGRTEH